MCMLGIFGFIVVIWTALCTVLGRIFLNILVVSGLVFRLLVDIALVVVVWSALMRLI